MVAGTVGKQSTDTPASDALIIIISIAIVIIVSIIIILDIKIKIYGGRNLFYKQGQFNRAGQCPTKLEQFHGAGQGRVPGRRGSSTQSKPALMLPVSQHPSLDTGQWTPPSTIFFAIGLWYAFAPIYSLERVSWRACRHTTPAVLFYRPPLSTLVSTLCPLCTTLPGNGHCQSLASNALQKVGGVQLKVSFNCYQNG